VLAPAKTVKDIPQIAANRLTSGTVLFRHADARAGLFESNQE
jgi:hypothetical protein